MKNYRVFREEATIYFKPITIVVGENSAGKSSIAKALLLLQENLRMHPEMLDFSTGKHKLGSFKSVLNQANLPLEFELAYMLNSDEESEKDTTKQILNKNEVLYVRFVYTQHPEDDLLGRLSELSISIKKEDVKESETLIKLKEEQGEEEGKMKLLFEVNAPFFSDLIESRKQDYDVTWDSIKNRITDELFYTYIEKSAQVLEVERDKLIEKKVQEKKKDLEPLIDIEVEREKAAFETKTKELRGEIERIDKDIAEKEADIDFDSEDELNKLLESLDELKEKKEKLENDIAQLEAELRGKIEDLQQNQAGSQEEELRIEAENEIGNDVKKYIDNLKKKEKLEFALWKILMDKIFDYVKTKIKNLKFSWDNDNAAIDINRDSIISKVQSLQLNQIITSALKDVLEEKLKNILDFETIIQYDDFTTLPLSFFKDIFEKEDIKNTVEKLNRHNFFIEAILSIFKECLECALSEIPFAAIYGVRAKQDRFYDVIKDDFSLEIAAKLLLEIERSLDGEKKEKQLNFIKEQLRKFSIIGEDIDTNDVVRCRIIDGSMSVVEIRTGKLQDNWRNIADFGLGISQLVPIIVHIAFHIDSHRLIFIEEPGIHLHPNYQSKLADLFVDAKKANVSIAVETHSEPFIRKMQYLVAKENNITNGDVEILYVSKFGDKMQSIHIQKDGSLDRDFISGFVDENDKWIEERKLLKIGGGIDKPTLFLEGDSDVAIIEEAINIFFPECIDKIQIASCSGDNGVKDLVLSWVASNRKSPVVGVFDEDAKEKKEALLKNINENYKSRNGKVKLVFIYEGRRNPEPEHLIELLKKRFRIPVAIEEMLPLSIWKHLEEKGMLEGSLFSKISIEILDSVTPFEYCEQQGIGELKLYLRKVSMKGKEYVCKYIKSMQIDEKSETLAVFKPLLEEILKFLLA